MKIVIAPNSFKNSLAADAVAEALREGILQSGFKDFVHCCPIGDGGDGTGAILRKHLKAKEIICNTVDPLERPIIATFGLTDDRTAIIELADASGLRLLQPIEYNPIVANTKGTGKLIKAALDNDAKKIILCIGGSATVDGGTGILQELGIIFKNSVGDGITQLPQRLADLENIDPSHFDKRLQDIEMQILCDVKNKLLGENGAAAVFGPQKGANDFVVKFLEKNLNKLNEVVYKTNGKRMSGMPHSGAAGGVASGLCAFSNAKAVDGISTFLDITNFEKQLKSADLVITGEGAIDLQTLDGKAPYGVAMAAREHHIPVIAVAGKIANDMDLYKCFDKIICINPPDMPLEEAIKNTRENLILTGKSIGQAYVLESKKTYF